MRQIKKAPELTLNHALINWRIALWLVVFGGCMFFWPSCLDRYLAPRFFFLSLALIGAILLLWSDLNRSATTRWHLFDWMLLAWYALNLVSVSWSMSWSEGIFYAQKTLLLLGVYFLVRNALLRDESMFRQTLKQITQWISAIVCIILLVQVFLAVATNGLDNDTLYNYASGVFGNKSLAAEFLYFLLIFNALFVLPSEKSRVGWGVVGLLILFIIILQVRTVYLSLALGVLAYVPARAYLAPGFKRNFVRKILPLGVLSIGILLGLLAWKGSGSSLVERINPLQYLESATSNERRFVWYRTEQLNADHFWLGVGNGSWKFWLPSKTIKGGYRQEEKNVVFTRAHNDYLEIRAEMGIVGLTLFSILFGLSFWAALAAMRKNERTDPRNQDILLASVGLLGYCVIQYFDFPRERIEFQIVLACLFALLAHWSQAFWSRFSWQGRSKSNLICWSGLLLGLMFNVLLGWQRMNGEIHNIRLMDAQSKSDWRRLQTESVLAENRFYQYTDAAIPLAWHEGIAWYQLGQHKKSVVAFERAYQLNPWSFQVINNYASGLVKLKRYQEAIPLFEKALLINPRYDEGKFNLSYVYYQMGDLAQSMECLNRVDTIANPGNQADRDRNRSTLKRLEEFRKVLEEKRR